MSNDSAMDVFSASVKQYSQHSPIKEEMNNQNSQSNYVSEAAQLQNDIRNLEEKIKSLFDDLSWAPPQEEKLSSIIVPAQLTLNQSIMEAKEKLQILAEDLEFPIEEEEEEEEEKKEREFMDFSSNNQSPQSEPNYIITPTQLQHRSMSIEEPIIPVAEEINFLSPQQLPYYIQYEQPQYDLSFDNEPQQQNHAIYVEEQIIPFAGELNLLTPQQLSCYIEYAQPQDNLSFNNEPQHQNQAISIEEKIKLFAQAFNFLPPQQASSQPIEYSQPQDDLSLANESIKFTYKDVDTEQNKTELSKPITKVKKQPQFFTFDNIPQKPKAETIQFSPAVEPIVKTMPKPEAPLSPISPYSLMFPNAKKALAKSDCYYKTLTFTDTLQLTAYKKQ
jgi:hypothetical protein